MQSLFHCFWLCTCTYSCSCSCSCMLGAFIALSLASGLTAPYLMVFLISSTTCVSHSLVSPLHFPMGLPLVAKHRITRFSWKVQVPGLQGMALIPCLHGCHWFNSVHYLGARTAVVQIAIQGHLLIPDTYLHVHERLTGT
jgi:hypothetical protein